MYLKMIQDYDKMKICITGGSGMVGSCIKDIANNYPCYEFVFLNGRYGINLENRDAVMRNFKENKYDAIIHLAANVGGLYKNMDKNVEMFNSNIKINQNVLEASNECNINRGIFCLSSCIYPANPEKFPMDETMIHSGPPHHSNSGYAYAKRMLEVQCRNYNNAYGREYICVVPVNLYGPYDNFDLNDGHLIPMVMHRFHNNLQNDDKSFVAYGTGTPLRQFLYAPDFARIICEVLLGDRYDSTEPIICCNDVELPITDVIETIANVMNIPTKYLSWDTTKSDGCLRKTVSNKKFKHMYPEFKFTELHDGLIETYKWFYNYKSNGSRIKII